MAIYDHLKKNMSKDPESILLELLNSEIDYVKFKNSFKNFYPELIKIVVDPLTRLRLDDLCKILRLSVSSVAHAAPLTTYSAFSPPGGRAAVSDPTHASRVDLSRVQTHAPFYNTSSNLQISFDEIAKAAYIPPLKPGDLPVLKMRIPDSSNYFSN